MDARVNHEEKCSFEFTTSWFLDSVNEFYSVARPRIVDYTASDSSNGEILLHLAPGMPCTSVNEPVNLFSSSIEHYVGWVGSPAANKHAKVRPQVTTQRWHEQVHSLLSHKSASMDCTTLAW